MNRKRVKRITIEQMAWVFEQRASGVSVESIACSLMLKPRTLKRWIREAEIFGFEAFKKRV
jgi:hypothetical protein